MFGHREMSNHKFMVYERVGTMLSQCHVMQLQNGYTVALIITIFTVLNWLITRKKLKRMTSWQCIISGIMTLWQPHTCSYTLKLTIWIMRYDFIDFNHMIMLSVLMYKHDIGHGVLINRFTYFSLSISEDERKYKLKLGQIM